MLKTLLSILGNDRAKAADLRNALDQLEASLPALEAAVRAAEQRRTGLLLDPAATDAQHDKADDALRLAVRERDRALAAKAELARKIEAADAAERAAALDAKRHAVEREALATAKALNRFVTLQREMTHILSQLEKAESAVIELNDELFTAGRNDLLEAVEIRVLPTPAGQSFDYHSIRNRTQLRELPGVPGWRDRDPEFTMGFSHPASHFAPRNGS